jgi:hypothetical protein
MLRVKKYTKYKSKAPYIVYSIGSLLLLYTKVVFSLFFAKQKVSEKGSVSETTDR